MRLKQNLILGGLIIVLISGIFLINMFNILSISKEDNPEFGREIKVNNAKLDIKEDSVLEIIWDVSGSMWGQVDKKNKITIAKEVVKQICSQLPNNVYLGLRIFGVTDKPKSNSFLVLEPAQNNNQKILDYVNKIKPAGKSPIAVNLLLAEKDLLKFNGSKHILLITDGKDTGELMPSRIIKKMSKKNIKTHIIHIDNINKVNQLQLKNLAELGNGNYFTYFEKKQVVPTINLE
ncbi:MAG: vWA domain-containing protein [Bacillota bacterium]